MAACTVLAAAAGGACSTGSEEADARHLADQLARALEAHDLGRVPLSSDTSREEYDRAVRDVEEIPASVDVADVRDDGHRATAVLSWSWELPGGDWRYTTTAALQDDGDRWEVDWDPSVLARGLRAGEQLDAERLPARRGDILDGRGEPIVTARPVVRLGLDKSRVPARRWGSSALRIARALDVDGAAYRRKVRAYGPEAFVEAIVLRVEDARSRVDDSYGAIPGAGMVADTLPLAPTREFAAPLLGSVGPATAEIISRSGGDLVAGDTVGLSGLQARYDDRLRGVPGTRIRAVDPDGSGRTILEQPARAGKDLRTSLDPRLQQRAEEALTDHVGPHGPASALVAVRPSTGEVLAAANGPGNGGLNVATAGQYAPGSTFKVVSALALLRQGATPATVGPCPATTVVDGRRFKNYDDYPSDRLGDITLRTAVASSCNTWFIRSWDDLPGDRLADAAASLGMGVDHDLGFPAYFGQVPPAAGDTEKAADLIGQGRILASPLAMATVAASVGAGHTVVPTLLPTLQPGAEASGGASPAGPVHPLAQAEAEQLRGLMRAVVTEGSGRFLLDLPGRVGAKTGTAEYGQPSDDGSLPTHTWMIATQEDLAVAVFVETGESGSATAGPILDEFLS